MYFLHCSEMENIKALKCCYDKIYIPFNFFSFSMSLSVLEICKFEKKMYNKKIRRLLSFSQPKFTSSM